MQFHYKPDPKKARKSTPRSAPEGLQPASLLSPASADPNLLIMNNSVLTGQFDPNLLQPGLVSQAVLPGSVSGMAAAGGWGLSKGLEMYHMSADVRNNSPCVRDLWCDQSLMKCSCYVRCWLVSVPALSLVF